MKRFQKQPVFNRKTGELEANELSVVSYVCDYCGVTISESAESNPAFAIVEDDCCEAQYHETEIEGLTHEQTLEFFSLNDVYHYCVNWDTAETCSTAMVEKCLSTDKNSRNRMLFNIMINARAELVKRLLKEGTTLEELGIEESN